MTKTTDATTPAIGFLRHSTRRVLTEAECRERNLPTQSSWYDHSYHVFEVVGPMDLSRIKNALHNRFWTPSCGKFGGGLSIGTVTQFDDTHILAEFIFHIGD